MNLHQIARTVHTVLNAPFSIFRPFNICLWHAGRCGSTVLSDLLKQGGRIVWGGEILEPYSKQVEARNLRSIAWKGAKRRIRSRQLAAGAKIFGFEMKVWHLMRMGIEPARALDFLKGLQFDKHIILERKNYLRIIVSGAVGRATSKLHCKLDESQASAKIHLDLEEVRKSLPIFTQFFEEVKKLLSEKCLFITYENDVFSDPVMAYKKIVNNLGLTPRSVTVGYRRTNPKNIEEIVTNIDEIRQYLNGTPYEWMLTAN